MSYVEIAGISVERLIIAAFIEVVGNEKYSPWLNDFVVGLYLRPDLVLSLLTEALNE